MKIIQLTGSAILFATAISAIMAIFIFVL